MNEVISGRLGTGQCTRAARDLIPTGIQQKDRRGEPAGRWRGSQGEFRQRIERQRPSLIAKCIHIPGVKRIPGDGTAQYNLKLVKRIEERLEKSHGLAIFSERGLAQHGQVVDLPTG